MTGQSSRSKKMKIIKYSHENCREYAPLQGPLGRLFTSVTLHPAKLRLWKNDALVSHCCGRRRRSFLRVSQPRSLEGHNDAGTRWSDKSVCKVCKLIHIIPRNFLLLASKIGRVFLVSPPAVFLQSDANRVLAAFPPPNQLTYN